MGIGSEKRFTLFSRRAERKSKHRFELTYGSSAYGPGDSVTGTIRPTKKIRVRELQVALAYVEQSCDHTEDVVVEEVVAPQSGRLTTASEVPFAVQMPADATPAWISEDREMASKARLYWAVVVTAPRWGPLPDRVERHELPLKEGSEGWSGPPAEQSFAEPTGSPKDWDVSLSLNRASVRRGEEVKASVSIGSASPERGGLDVGLVCEVHYDVETTTSTGSGTTTARETRTERAHEERIPLDPSMPLQDIHLEVPADAPFSYGEREVSRLGPLKLGESTGKGSAVVIEWKVEAREDRRLRRDPHRCLPLQVLP